MRNILDHRLSGIAFFIIFLVILLRSFIDQSFWLDEAATVWVIDAGLKETLSRAFFFQGQSPLYYLLVLPIYQVFGANEAILRLPSILFLTVSCWALYRIARTNFSSEVSLFILIPFISIDPILVAGISARPYALALMCSLLSIMFLFDWRKTKGKFSALLSIFFLILMIYAHPLFSPFIAIHLLVTFNSINVWSARNLSRLICILFSIAILITPVAIQCLYLFTRKDTLHFAIVPDFTTYLTVVFPPYFTIYFLSAFLLVLIFIGRFNLASHLQDKVFSAQLLAIWLLLGPTLLFSVSVIGDKSLFIPRYFLWSMPALALLCGFFLDRIQDKRALHLFILTFSLLVLVRESGRVWTTEGWREAVQYISSDNKDRSAPVIVSSGFIEGALVSFLTEPLKTQYLLSPVKIYGGFKFLKPIPRDLNDPELKHYYETRILPTLNLSKTAYLVCLNQTSLNDQSKTVCQSLSETILKSGFSSTDTQMYGLVSLIKFAKTGHPNF